MVCSALQLSLHLDINGKKKDVCVYKVDNQKILVLENPDPIKFVEISPDNANNARGYYTYNENKDYMIGKVNQNTDTYGKINICIEQHRPSKVSTIS